MPKPVKLSHLEIWSDLQCAGGVRLAAIVETLAASDQRELGGLERLLVQLRRTDLAWAHVLHTRVIRAVDSDGTWEEWRIADVDEQRDERGGLQGSIECSSPLLDLAEADRVITRTEADGTAAHDFGLFGLTPAEALTEILTWAPAHFTPGTVQPTARIDLNLSWDSPLSALRQLAELTDSDLELERNGTTGYRVHLLARTRALTAGARIRYARNQRGIRRKQNVDPLLTRAYPRGAAEDGLHADMGEAAWSVVAAAGASITLEAGVVAFPGQLNGLWAENARTGARSAISASGTNQVLQLGSAIAAAGDLVHIRLDGTGKRLTYLDNPGAAARYLRPGRHRAKVLDLQDVPGTNNLVENAFTERWTGGTPDSFSALNGGQLVRETSKLYRQHGTSSVKVTAAGDGEGIQTGWITIAPTDPRPFYTAQIALWVAAGKVRLELVAETATGVQLVFPDGAKATTSIVGAWVENLAIAGEDLRKAGAVRARIRVVAEAAAATFYLDAAQLTQTAAGAETFYSGRGANELWKEANRALAEHQDVEETYDVSLVDLERIDPGAFALERIRIGDLVSVYDPDLQIETSVRIVAVQRNRLVPGAVSVQLSTRAPGITGQLGGVTTARRGRAARVATEAELTPTEPFGAIQVSVVVDTARFVFAGNERARSFGWRIARTPPAAESADSPTGLTIVDARSGEITVPKSVLTVGARDIVYVIGYFFDQPAGGGTPGRRAIGESPAPSLALGPIDPAFPLKNGEYLGSLRDIQKAASEAIGMAQSFIFAFSSQSGEGGLPIDKILTQPLYTPDGLIKLIDTELKQIHQIAFGSTVKDAQARRLDQMLLKIDPTAADNATGIAYSDGTTVDFLKPAQAGSDKTSLNTAADVAVGVGKAVLQAGADKTSLNVAADVQVGAGLAVLQRGADVTGSNTAADVQVGVGKAVAQAGADKTGSNTAADVATGVGKAVVQAGADKTSLNVAADAAAVAGVSAATVKDGAAKGNAGLDALGNVLGGKVGEAALVNSIFGTNLILDRLFAANVWTNALFTKIVGADTVVTRNLTAQDIVAVDIFAENLAAITAVLGEIAAGILMNTSRVNLPTAAIRLSSDYTMPASVARYIDLAGIATHFIFHPSLKVPVTGDAEFTGGGTFKGTVQAGRLQSPNNSNYWDLANPSGLPETILASIGKLNIRGDGSVYIGSNIFIDAAGNGKFGGTLQAAAGTFGLITAGKLHGPNADAQINLQPVDGYFLLARTGGLGSIDTLRIGHNGSIFIKGDIQADSGYFSGEVRSSNFTSLMADFTGTVKMGELRLKMSQGDWLINASNIDTVSRLVFSYAPGGGWNSYLHSNGRFSAKGYDVYSPTPPKLAEEMTVQDWAAWGVEDAKKPVWAHENLPSPDHPVVLEEARRTRKAKAVIAQREDDRHRKDLGKIAIGTARGLEGLLAAIAEASDLQDLKARLGMLPAAA